MGRRPKNADSLVDDEVIVEHKIRELDITPEMSKNFVAYSNEINKRRAFSYVYPGLKPIVGHIIWAMHANGRTSNKPYTKSAKVKGEVMSYSPHAEAYDAMVRLAQPFVYHCPFIDGHGSFGSIVGGPEAGADRYTEMRLTKFAEDVLLYNTKILHMGLNYLEEDPEPILKDWVALLPLLFMTNTEGMGYTVSNRWTSGNLFEFRDQLLNYVKTGEVDCSKIYPDLPTGGIIINKSEMKDLYETGKGSIKLRGKTEIVNDTIRILSLPYQRFPENFIDDLKKYYNENANTIKEFRNMCGKEGKDLVFLIEIDCEQGTAEYTLDQLFKKTCLQISIADDHKAINELGKPVTITFKDYMKDFVKGNIEIVINEAKYNLEEINSRLEILEGLLNALDVIDKIIAEIKKSKSMEDAKNTVMSMKFKGKSFTERQADAIVHMPLGRLANLEQIKLQTEKDELLKKKAENEDLRDNKKTQIKYFLKRFNALVDKYGWERKTEVIDLVETADSETGEGKAKPARIAKPEKLKVKKEYMIVLTSENCLKRVNVMKFRQTNEDEKSIKVQGKQKIIMVSNKGQMYKVVSNQIDECLPNASGTPITELRPEIGDEKIIAIYDEDISLPYVYFVTKEGYGKLGDVKSHLLLSKAIGAPICTMKPETDEIIAVKLLNKGEKIEINTNKRTEVIEMADKPSCRWAGGKKIIKLAKDEQIIDVHSIK